MVVAAPQYASWTERAVRQSEMGGPYSGTADRRLDAPVRRVLRQPREREAAAPVRSLSEQDQTPLVSDQSEWNNRDRTRTTGRRQVRKCSAP